MKRQSGNDARKTQDEFEKQLKAGNLGLLYLFEGEEALLRDQALDRLISLAVDPNVRDFNVSSVNASGGDLGAALSIARQLPMMSTRRAVAVLGFEAISDDRQIEKLRSYLDDPSPSSVVIFVSNGLDNRRAISGMLRRACTLVSFKSLADDATPWVLAYLTRGGVKIGAAEAAYLVGMVGADLRRLSNEADKLAIRVGPGGRITRVEIDGLVHYSREHSNFELSDAIGEGDRVRALRLLDHIFAEKVEAVMVLGAIGSVFRRMLAAKDLMAQGASNEEVAKAIGMPAYYAGKFNERVRRIDLARIREGMRRIAETDVALKTSLGTPRLQLEVLICELCPSSGKAKARESG
ncbi:MAG: DNA polymerase III subunit delta [Acidobacteriota bacterium]